MRRIITSAASVALALNFASPATANFYSGNELFAQCSATETDTVYYAKHAFCSGYIIGAADTQEGFGAVLKGKLYCLPPGVIAKQLTDVVLAYLQQHPETRQMAADSLVGAALMRAFPCPK